MFIRKKKIKKLISLYEERAKKLLKQYFDLNSNSQYEMGRLIELGKVISELEEVLK